MTTVQPFASACFFSTDNGATVQRRTSRANELQFPIPASPAVTNIYRFDETGTNNVALSALWESDASRFTMAGSAVLLDEQQVEFDAPGLLFRALQNASVLYAKLESTPDALTREEQAQIAAIGFRALGLI